MSDFDQIINRKNTNSIKWDSLSATYGEEDLLPLWIADMDFKMPRGVFSALQHTLDKEILGYEEASEKLYQSIIDWERAHHQLALKKEEILLFPGVLAGITTAIQALTKTNDTILIHDPVYPPFAKIVTANHRKLVRSRLIEKDNKFVMDFDDIEEKFRAHSVKAMILCNPHNPGGRVWTKEELMQLGKLCQKYNVLVFSDEIHQDLVFPPYKMTSFFTVDDSFSGNSIQFTSMTKTFNLAGIKVSTAFIKDARLRTKILRKQEENFLHEINTFGLVGMEAAYQTGNDWLSELLPYLQSNIAHLTEQFSKHLPKVSIMKPEGTYLLWLDFSAYGFSDEELVDRLVHKGKVVLNAGTSFGTGGSQHMRLNVACPRELLDEGIKRICSALR